LLAVNTVAAALWVHSSQGMQVMIASTLSHLASAANNANTLALDECNLRSTH
jgi:hypothetical protein